MNQDDNAIHGINKLRIKPIETHYKNYRFRSRLEARWAIFFDALGIEWDYEPEGFEFDGIKYLPDFYLPGLGIWCEIKGKLNWHSIAPAGTDPSRLLYYERAEELEIADKFRWQDNAICVIVGSPGKERIYFYGFDACDSGGGSFEDDDSKWIISEDGKPTLFVNPCRADRMIYSDSLFDVALPWLVANEDQKSLNKINKAVKCARSARFEYGENSSCAFQKQPK